MKTVMIGRSASTVAALACLAVVVGLAYALFDAKGVRFWENPGLAITGGVLVIAGTVAAGVLARRSWQEVLRPSKAAWLALLFMAMAAVGGFLVLSSTSTAYTPTVEIVR